MKQSYQSEGQLPIALFELALFEPEGLVVKHNRIILDEDRKYTLLPAEWSNPNDDNNCACT